MTAPDVSIILISFNDAARLPRAIAAAQVQTLHNIEIIVVDDASTDATPEVVAAIDDPRVRSIRLPVNSGGCSAPRNAGLAAARGTWVMFADSDDELEMHAAKNLLIAVEQFDADLGCGVAERVDVHTGKTKRWRHEAHEPGVITNIAERPELLFDTICVNKIYRRSWLVDQHLAFVDGLLYEDQLFTLQCYLRANRIAVIDPIVYRWYVERLSDSITQRRGEQRNVDSRIAINQLIDAELTERTDLRPEKDYKFLAHDLYLYLSTMQTLDDATANELMTSLADYTKTLDITPAQRLRPGVRIALYHLLLGDLDGVRRAMRLVKWAAVLDMPVVTRDGRDFWGCEHLTNGSDVGGYPPQWWLDITALHPSIAPIPQQRPCHVVETVGGEIAGSTVDAYGNADRLQSVSLAWVGRGDRILATAPLTWQMSDGRVHWRGQLRHPGLRGMSGHLALLWAYPQTTNCTAIRAASVAYRVESLSITSGENGSVRWRDDREPWSTSHRILRRIARLAGAFPRDHSVIFGADAPVSLGAPAAISALLAERAPDIVQWWVEHPSAPPAPATAQAIRANSPAHAYRAARARFDFEDDLSVPPKWSRGQRIDANTGVPIVQGTYDPIGIQAALTDVHTARAALDITGPVRCAVVDPHEDWVPDAQAVDGTEQLLVRASDGTALQIPAVVRAWVRDVRGIPQAQIRAICAPDMGEVSTTGVDELIAVISA
jgi:glycosyltransferase involved in cell wall biosynthesis